MFCGYGEADQVNHSGKGGRVPYIWIVGGLGVVLALLVMCILVCICMRSSSCSSTDEDGGGGHNFQILRKSGFFCGSGRYNCCRSGDIRQTNGETQSHHQVVAIPKGLILFGFIICVLLLERLFYLLFYGLLASCSYW